MNLRSFSARGAIVLVLGAACLSSSPAAAAEKGWSGFSMSVELETLWFNPTLRGITVSKVEPGSPAAAAGMLPGDRVLEVEGIVVAGTKSDVLRAAMGKGPGEKVRFKVKRASAEPHEVTLLLVPKP